jgi:hypothetical protein
MAARNAIALVLVATAVPGTGGCARALAAVAPSRDQTAERAAVPGAIPAGQHRALLELATPSPAPVVTRPPVGVMQYVRDALRRREIDVRFGSATSFRWHDGQWCTRVEVTVTNRGPRTLHVERAWFDGTANGVAMLDMQSVTFPSSADIDPGASETGTVGFYYASTLAEPTSVEVSFAMSDAPERPIVREIVTAVHAAAP